MIGTSLIINIVLKETELIPGDILNSPGTAHHGLTETGPGDKIDTDI